jgi:hypothetical protein
MLRSSRGIQFHHPVFSSTSGFYSPCCTAHRSCFDRLQAPSTAIPMRDFPHIRAARIETIISTACRDAQAGSSSVRATAESRSDAAWEVYCCLIRRWKMQLERNYCAGRGVTWARCGLECFNASPFNERNDKTFQPATASQDVRQTP